jgi:hypothetical protein
MNNLVYVLHLYTTNTRAGDVARMEEMKKKKTRVFSKFGRKASREETSLRIYE